MIGPVFWSLRWGCPLNGGAIVDLGLQGKVAVVTGASKGIGLAVTKAFIAEGVRVVARARNVKEELAALTRGVCASDGGRPRHSRGTAAARGGS